MGSLYSQIEKDTLHMLNAAKKKSSVVLYNTCMVFTFPMTQKKHLN